MFISGLRDIDLIEEKGTGLCISQCHLATRYIRLRYFSVTYHKKLGALRKTYNKYVFYFFIEQNHMDIHLFLDF